MAQVWNMIKHKASGGAVFALVLLIAGGAVAVRAADVPGTAEQGAENDATVCSACHGANGMGQPAGGIPRLAGLNAAYLARQLDDFGNGTRQSPVMAPIAKALNPGQRKALAVYYSRLPVSVSKEPLNNSMFVIPAKAGIQSFQEPGHRLSPVRRINQRLPKDSHASVPPTENNLGERLAERGIWSKQVPGCVQCHGPHGVGVGANFPPLAGQSAFYIANQLHAWQNGTRCNDPLGLMRHVALALNQKDIQAVAEWFAAQPIAPHEGVR